MKKSFYFLFFILIFGWINAQQKITVQEELYGGPVPKAEVFTLKDSLIGTTNSQGIIFIPDSIHTLQINYPGYPKQTFEITQTPTTITLLSDLYELEGIIFDGNNPKAKALIKAVIKNQKQNSIDTWESYGFNSYSKFWADAQKDSIPFVDNPISKQDSMQNEDKKLLEESMYFISERAINHYYDKKHGKKNKVVAVRMSGLKTPLFEFAAAQPISYEFKDDDFNFFFRKFPNPLSNKGLRSYYFTIKDTIISQNHTLIKVAFQSNKKQKNSLHGYVMIDDSMKALTEFYAENETKKGSETYIEVAYQPFHKKWVPKHQFFRLEYDDNSYRSYKDSVTAQGALIRDTVKVKARTWMNAQTIFNNFETPKIVDKKVFKGYEDEVGKEAFADFEKTINQYRPTPLTERELNTYVKIDSLGKVEGADKALKLYRILSTGGYYQLGKIDVDLKQFFYLNEHEGVRIGTGIRTNYLWNETVSLNGRINYGFKDKKVKFSLGTEINVTPANSGKIIANYTQDIEASGRYYNHLRPPFSFINSSFSNISTSDYYELKKGHLSYQQDLFNNLTVSLGVEKSEEKNLFDYRYNGNNSDQKYKSTSTQLNMRWAPHSKFVSTPFGKVTLQSKMPIFYLSLDKNWDALGGEFNYTKLDLTAHHSVNIFRKKTSLQLSMGRLWGDAPIWKYFEGGGTAKESNNIGGRFGLGRLEGFETMFPGEFYSDTYMSWHIKQPLFNLKLFKNNIPTTLVYNGGWGDTKTDLSVHSNFTFKNMNDTYHEVGLEIDSLVLGAFGLGAYYRLGEYSYGDFDQDFTLKFIININSILN